MMGEGLLLFLREYYHILEIYLHFRSIFPVSLSLLHAQHNPVPARIEVAVAHLKTFAIGAVTKLPQVPSYVESG